MLRTRVESLSIHRISTISCAIKTMWMHRAPWPLGGPQATVLVMIKCNTNIIDYRLYYILYLLCNVKRNFYKLSVNVHDITTYSRTRVLIIVGPYLDMFKSHFLFNRSTSDRTLMQESRVCSQTRQICS